MGKSFYDIYKTFFKVGTMLLGGGYVILPLLKSELVEKKKWITYDELCEFMALGASLPGVIAINTAIFTGRRLGKTTGAIAATLGVVTPAFIAIILLASIFTELVAVKIVQNIFWGVGLGIIVLLFLAIKDLWGKSVVDKTSFLIFLAVLLCALFTKIPLYILIICSLLAGVLIEYLTNRNGTNA